tara:strand:- start:6310 stop:7020 length:711 start_codon:yes stop_codon:yes gene_type:complete
MRKKSLSHISQADEKFYQFFQMFYEDVHNMLESYHTISTDPATFTKYSNDPLTQRRAKFHSAQLRSRIMTIATLNLVPHYEVQNNTADSIMPMQLCQGRYRAFFTKNFDNHFLSSDIEFKYKIYGGSRTTFQNRIKDLVRNHSVSLRMDSKQQKVPMIVPELKMILKESAINCLGFLYRMDAYGIDNLNLQKKIWTEVLGYSENMFERGAEAVSQMSLTGNNFSHWFTDKYLKNRT